MRARLKATVLAAKTAYDAKVAVDLNDPDRGAPCTGSKPGLMRNSLPGLHEFSFKLREGAVPQRQDFRHTDEAETAEIRRQLHKMLVADVIAACSGRARYLP